jgi:hypothetical protein
MLGPWLDELSTGQTPASPRPSMPKFRGHPPGPSPGPRCAQTQAALARLPAPGSVTAWQTAPIGSLSGPR